MSDSSGNAAAEVTRTVNVVDTANPVITLLGSPPDRRRSRHRLRRTPEPQPGHRRRQPHRLHRHPQPRRHLHPRHLHGHLQRHRLPRPRRSRGDQNGQRHRHHPTRHHPATARPRSTSKPGTVYVDAGATASDSFEGDLTSSIFTVNPVNTSLVGTYTITYTVSDSSGNAATPVTRIVNVIDTTPPVITLSASTPIDVEAGSAYTDAGATAWDTGDGDLTASIVTINPVNTSVLGTYTVTYNVTDSQGHTATEVTRTVNVIDTTPPVIVLVLPTRRPSRPGTPTSNSVQRRRTRSTVTAALSLPSTARASTLPPSAPTPSRTTSLTHPATPPSQSVPSTSSTPATPSSPWSAPPRSTSKQRRCMSMPVPPPGTMATATSRLDRHRQPGRHLNPRYVHGDLQRHRLPRPRRS